MNHVDTRNQAAPQVVIRMAGNTSRWMPDEGLRSPGPWGRGHCFVGDKLVACETVSAESPLGLRLASGAFEDVIKECNGHFVLVAVCRNEICAAVDRVRSIPLYYAVQGGLLYLADDAYWVEQQLGNPGQIERLAAAEFLLTGFVTGADTLVGSLRQLQAGEYLSARHESGAWRVGAKRYFVLADNIRERSRPQLVDEFGASLDASMDRLLAFANDRVLALPLSGGFDSRLLALKLKQRGVVRRVVAFTYGVPGNRDSSASKEMADALGFQWAFVPYSEEQWKSWYASSTFREFLRSCDGLSALPYITSFPAVWFLREKALLPDDAVFMPGHTLDFISGAQIPLKYKTCSTVSRDELVRDIYQKHYGKWSWDYVRSEVPGVEPRSILARILSRCACVPPEVMPVSQAIDLFEAWNWQERQAKAIVNTVRICEFWKHPWHLPYWDGDILAFWKSVPHFHRFNRKLAGEYIEDLSFALTGKRHADLWPERPYGFMAEGLPRRLLCKFLDAMANTTHMGLGRLTSKNPLALYGVVDRRRLRQTWGKASLPHSYWISDRLQAILETRSLGDSARCA